MKVGSHFGNYHIDDAKNQLQSFKAGSSENVAGLATLTVHSNSTVASVEGRSTAIGGDVAHATATNREYGTIGGGALANLFIS